jgi:hypothetical protein
MFDFSKKEVLVFGGRDCIIITALHSLCCLYTLLVVYHRKYSILVFRKSFENLYVFESGFGQPITYSPTVVHFSYVATWDTPDGHEYSSRRLFTFSGDSAFDDFLFSSLVLLFYLWQGSVCVCLCLIRKLNLTMF